MFLLCSLVGAFESFISGIVSLLFYECDDVFYVVLVLLDKRREENLVNHGGTIGLRGHQENEENHSQNVVVRDECEDEFEEHLDQLENSEYAPEAQPGVDVLFSFGLDGSDGLYHWVDTCQ